MAVGDKYWDHQRGEWVSGNVHPGVTADLKEDTLSKYLKIEMPQTETKVTGEVTTGSTFEIGSIENYLGEPFKINDYNQINYKYDEAKYLGELRAYIDSTYGQHYSQNQFQATEFIIDGGHGTGFCIGNVLKYAQRYGRKGTPEDWRKDLMKVIHYAVIQLYVHDLENSKGEKK